MTQPRTATPFAAEIRFILTAAMLLFVYTVVVGILNGLDLVDFPHKPLLAHLHVGTLGWITMAVCAASLALFGTAEAERASWVRTLARSAPVVALGYNIAFFLTTGYFRPIMGALMLLVIVAFAGWGYANARGKTLSVPHIGILAGLTTSVIGAVLGILLGVYIANPASGITPNVAAAHPATMVVGFLVPVGMALSEWVMRPGSVNDRASIAGWLQIIFPFAGGVALMVGTLINVLPLVMLSLPLEIGGLAIYLVRMSRNLRGVSLLAATPERFGVLAAVFLLVNISIFTYLIANYAADFESTPPRLFLALDHSIFVGVLTVSILGFIATVAQAARPAWMGHLVFFGVALGITGFVASLLADSTPGIRTATPILGTAILFAIATHLMELRRT